MKKLSVKAARRLTDRLCFFGWLLMWVGAGLMFWQVRLGQAVMILGFLIVWSWVPIYRYCREET